MTVLQLPWACGKLLMSSASRESLLWLVGFTRCRAFAKNKPPKCSCLPIPWLTSRIPKQEAQCIVYNHPEVDRIGATEGRYRSFFKDNILSISGWLYTDAGGGLCVSASLQGRR